MITDYNKYKMSKKELILTYVKGFVILAILSYLFFQNIMFIIILSPLTYLFYLSQKKKKIEQRKWELNVQFRDSLLNVLAALDVGLSIENAFHTAYQDLKLIYKEADYIVEEYRQISFKLKANQNIEEILCDLGEKSHVEDIICFADVLLTAKRSGGDIVSVIRATCSVISDKIEVKKDIKTVIMEKKLEADVMKLVPCGIICYFNLASPGFLSPLYHNPSGIIIMSILLITYLGTIKLMERLVAIQI